MHEVGDRERRVAATEAEQPLIHIGYHKTGTTWLQRHLFPSAANGFSMPLGPRAIDRLVRGPGPWDFDPVRVRQQLLASFELACREKLMPVLSAEMLSGTPHSGGYDSREIADRLFELFPRGRIVVVIREQKEMIASTYRQYVRIGGGGSLRDYLVPPSDGRIPLFRLDHFAYDRLIEYYLGCFGDNVLVLPYEDFRRDPAGFVGRLAAFCGRTIGTDLPYSQRVNDGPSALVVGVQRRLNPLSARRRTSVNPHPARVGLVEPVISAVHALDRRVPQRVKRQAAERLRLQVGRLVGTRYADSNARTAQLTGIDLGSLGYAV